MELINVLLLIGEASLYFVLMAALFWARRKVGLGVFVCVLGSLHFLETYLASIFYVDGPFGTGLSPGSTVLFSGKLVLLLLLYIREDAAAVRQPIYGLIFGNALIVTLIAVLRRHTIDVPGQVVDFPFLNQMSGLMVWSTLLLFVDGILMILIYERLSRFHWNVVTRIFLSTAAVLTFDHFGFYLALRFVFETPTSVLLGGWIGKMVAAAFYAGLAGLYLRFFERESKTELRPRLADVFDTLTYRERYQVLLEQTDRDGLTGLYNRGRFERLVPDHVRNAATNNAELSLILVDIDDFKMINDGRGHSCGDDVLRFVGSKLLETIRTSDNAFRYGGDEFLAVAEGLGPAAALGVAERLREAIEAGSAGAGVPITISVGVASMPVDANSIAGLFATADSRLYEAKSHGRNRVIGVRSDSDLKSDSVHVGG